MYLHLMKDANSWPVMRMGASFTREGDGRGNHSKDYTTPSSSFRAISCDRQRRAAGYVFGKRDPKRGRHCGLLTIMPSNFAISE